MVEHELHEEEIESSWEAAPAITLVIVGQIVLAIVSRTQDWTLWGFPWWVWLIPVGPEVVLLLPLALRRPRQRLEQLGRRRMVALALLGLISLGNALLLLAVIASLIQGDEKSGAQLLFKALIVWNSNVITYGLWYWEFDRGGPIARARGTRAHPDFLFPQMTTPELADSEWEPNLIDYLYVSFTNATAFSPTDTLPLSRWTKVLMAIQSLVALTTVGLVIARAVNVLA